MVSAKLGATVFGGDNPNGDHIVLESIEGWHVPASSGSVTQRSGGHGGWSTRAYLAPKVMTVNAVLFTRRALDTALADILASVPLDEPQPLTVVEVGGSRFANVRQDGEPDIEEIGPHQARLALPLIAPDPHRYGSTARTRVMHLPQTVGGLTFPTTVPFTIDAEVTSGQFGAINSGNTTAPLVVTFRGPVTRPRITNTTTGDRLTYDGTLADGESLVVDMDRRTVLLNGVVTRRGYVTGTFFGLVPGENQISFTAPTFNPDATATLAWRDTWK